MIIVVKLLVTGLVDSQFFCIKYCLGKWGGRFWVFHVDFFKYILIKMSEVYTRSGYIFWMLVWVFELTSSILLQGLVIKPVVWLMFRITYDRKSCKNGSYESGVTVKDLSTHLSVCHCLKPARDIFLHVCLANFRVYWYTSILSSFWRLTEEIDEKWKYFKIKAEAWSRFIQN